MSIPWPGPDTTLLIRRIFAAPRPRVFSLWTEPQYIKKWFGGPGNTVLSAEVDLRVGGHYRIIMQPQGGAPSQVSGTYREIEIPAKLVFTWNLVDVRVPSSETLVTVTFHEMADTTEVVILHRPLLDAWVRTLHAEGWADCLDAMADLLD